MKILKYRIEKRLLLAMLLILIAVLLVFSLLSINVLRDTSYRVEKQQIEKLAKNAMRVLLLDLKSLEVVSKDYSSWGQLYDVVNSDDKLKIDLFYESEISHLNSDSNSAFIVNNGDSIVKSSDDDREFILRLIYNKFSQSSEKYFVVTRQKEVFWVVSRPILMDGRSSIEHYFVLIRRLNRELIENLRRVFDDKVDIIYKHDGVSDYDNFFDVDIRLVSYSWNDSFSDGLFEVLTESEKVQLDVFVRKFHSVDYLHGIKVFIYLVIATILLIMTGLLILLRRFVTIPLAEINQWLKESTEGKGLISKFDYAGNDEIGDMSDNIYNMHRNLQLVSKESNKIVNSMGDYVFKVDEEGKVLYCSESCEMLIGIKKSDIINNPVDILIQLKEYPSLLPILAQVLDGNTLFDSHQYLRVYRKDAPYLQVRLVISRLEKDMLIVIRNIKSS
ncbi:CHASE4 domain-containing protein [Vibrio hangzhouensis]|nr:CHASE4 domain-containing protein [Vibrio hangzhouensis]